jgi:lysophospholipase L1-like esterase
MDAIAPASPKTLLLFGDSRIAQWKPLPDRPYPIAVAGYPGSTAIELTGRFQQDLRTHRPGVVVVQLGINDAVAASLVGAQRRARALADSLAALERMAADSQAAGAELVLLKVLPPVRPGLVRRVVYRAHVDAYVAAMNAALPAIADRHGATVVDALPALTDASGDVPDSFRRDALHFTPEAYVELGRLLPLSIEQRG